MKKFKQKLEGERLVLKRTKPVLGVAQKVFDTVDGDREHLAPWFPWEKETKKVEDSLEYLFDSEKAVKKGEKVQYGVYVDGEYIGNVGVFDINEKKKSAEIGYWLSSKYTRKGYMTEAVRIIEEEFFNNRGINRMQIQCDEKNVASAGVAKKCGYTYEGMLRESSLDAQGKGFVNTLVFSKLKSEYKKRKRKKK